jgi:hypothetical protein
MRDQRVYFSPTQPTDHQAGDVWVVVGDGILPYFLEGDQARETLEQMARAGRAFDA